MEIEFRCLQCGSIQQQEDLKKTVACSSCCKSYGSVRDFADEESRLRFCVICRCRDLYVQKDFNRKVGLAIVIVGAILAPFTRLISLFVCAFIDLLLYLALPLITICYRCHAIYRDSAKNP